MWCLLPESRPSTSSRAEAGGSLPTSCLDTTPLAQSKSKHIPERFCFNGSLTDAYLNSLFGTTCEHSDLTTQTPAPTSTGCAESEANSLSVADSPARTSHPQGRAQASPESEVGSGKSLLASLARYDRATSSWRTHRSSSGVASKSFSEILPQWGMILDGELYPQDVSVDHRSASDSGYWPTPSGTRSGKNHVVGRLDEWGGSSNRFRGTSLQSVRCPDFEEWMIGFPVSWTALTPLGTDSLRLWQQQHGDCLMSTEPDWQEEFDHRAAILEYDGGFTRAEAEEEAGYWVDGQKRDWERRHGGA